MIGSLVLFAFAAWWETRRFADTPLSYEQALAYVDPRLLPPDPDPAAVERGKKLLQAAKFLDDPEVGRIWRSSIYTGLAGLPPDQLRSAREFLRRHRKDFASLQAAYEASGDAALSTTGTDWRGGLIDHTDALLFFSRLAAANGDTALATELLSDAASRYSQCNNFTGRGAGLAGLYSASRILIAAESSLHDLPLSAEQYVHAMKHMPPSGQASPAIRSSLQFIFRDDVLPQILDARTKRSARENVYGSAQLQDERILQLSDYDKISTLRTLANLYLRALDRVETPWNPSYAGSDPGIDAAIKGLPPNLPTVSGSLPPGIWDQITQSYGCRNSPNLLGKLIIIAKGFAGSSMPFRYTEIRHDYESARLLLALCAYKKGHANVLPPKLQDLVAEGILDSLPEDPFSGRPYRYDAARGILWSTGPDRVDNGGTPPSVHGGSDDLVVRLL